MHHLSPLIRAVPELSTASSTTPPPPETLGLNTGKRFPHPSEGPRSRSCRSCSPRLRADQQGRQHVLSCTSGVLSKKKSPHFRPVPVQMHRVTLLQSHPSCYQTTTHSGKIQARRKRREVAEASPPVCAAGQMEFVMFCSCCARAM